jgi:hypothetical protein
MVVLIKKIIRGLKKSHIISKENKARGGVAERHLIRHIRQQGILGEKVKVASSMLNDWRMGFIKKPLPEEVERFESMARKERGATLTWSEIHRIQKKYWDEGNI